MQNWFKEILEQGDKQSEHASFNSDGFSTFLFFNNTKRIFELLLLFDKFHTILNSWIIKNTLS
jgi:hypothetical protein